MTVLCTQQNVAGECMGRWKQNWSSGNRVIVEYVTLFVLRMLLATIGGFLGPFRHKLAHCGVPSGRLCHTHKTTDPPPPPCTLFAAVPISYDLYFGTVAPASGMVLHVASNSDSFLGTIWAVQVAFVVEKRNACWVFMLKPEGKTTEAYMEVVKLI
jgi:hypothetical protein